MTRFIISHRRAGKFGKAAQQRSRALMDTTFSRSILPYVQVVKDQAPKDSTARRLTYVKGDFEELFRKAAELPPDVLIEPVIEHQPAWTFPLNLRWLAGNRRAMTTDFACPQWTMPLGYAPAWTFPLNHPSRPSWSMPLRSMPLESPIVGTGRRLRLKVTGSGPIANVEVILLLLGPGEITAVLKSATDAKGNVSFSFSPDFQPVIVVAEPHGDFWTLIVRGPVDGQNLVLSALPKDGRFGWWHQVCGIDSTAKLKGTGIRVGVVDTGLGPHPHLKHTRSVGAFIDGNYKPKAGADVDRHGTHVAGTIAARATADAYTGAAPRVTLLAARVFPSREEMVEMNRDPDEFGANQGDIADAIDHLSRTGRVDLINLSLGSSAPSEIERDAIKDALERGTLCICAAGNDGATPISYPARFPECVAVSAVGQNGWGALGSPTAANYPNEPEKYGLQNLFLAEFSNFGPQVACAAPGNGIIATVPARPGQPQPFAALDGTSMASPMACGLLAAVLSSDAQYKALPRDARRAEHARTRLRAACVDIGLARHFQGSGIPHL